MSVTTAGPTQLTVAQFYDHIQQENDFLLLDVRNEASFQSWRIESRYTPETLHLPYVHFVVDERKALKEIPNGREVVVVCAVGGSSDFVSRILYRAGMSVGNLVGGMEAWSKHYIFRPVVENEKYQLYQVDRVSRGCLSYVLISQGRALIVDPLRHVDQYQRFLAAKESMLEAVIDTHAHADHISGGPALASAYGVPYYLHPYDAIHPVDMLSMQVPYAMLAEGQQFDLGDVRIEILHMPGHTLGQVNVLIQDEGSASYLLTGDMVFLNGFGRPDMGGHSDSWAQLAYETLFSKFKKQIAPDTLILPGHYADFAEANEANLFVKTMAELWQQNSCLHFDSEESFRDYAACYASKSPTHYIDIKRVNMGLRQLSEAQLSELELGKNACALTR